MKKFSFFTRFILIIMAINSLLSGSFGNDQNLEKEQKTEEQQKYIQVKNILKSSMPKNLASVFFSAMALKDIEATLGKATLVEKDNHFYDLEKFKYSLSINYNQNKIKTIKYKFTKNKIKYSDLQDYINEKTTIIEHKGKHDEGRFFSRNINNIKITFKNNSKKQIESILRVIKE